VLPADNGAPPQHLNIRTAGHDDIVVVTLAGEIDHDNRGVLHDALQDCAERSGRIVLDLSGVSFMDSTGISVLLAASQTVRERPGGWLRIAAPSGPVLRVLQLVGLDTVLAVHPSVAEALSA
jgi:stage II sporulation protein AA (anti-sigma F factor antagonist)